jgi:hypothetical protein
MPFPPNDCAFDGQTQQKSLTGVTGDAEENRCGSSVSPVTPVRAFSFGDRRMHNRIGKGAVQDQGVDTSGVTNVR